MRKYSLPALALAILICFAAGSFAASPAPPLADPGKLKYPPLQFKPPQAERVVLDNGMILYILEDRELPLVNIHAVVKTGSYFDPPGKEGLAEIAGAVMRTGGTAAMSGSEIDETLEWLAVNLGVSAQMESFTIRFSSLRNTLETGMGILSRIMMRPAFEEGKLRLEKNLKMEELRRISDDPQQLTFRKFSQLLYRGDPRGRLAGLHSVDRIQREDLVLFHRRFFSPDNTMIAVTGDISKEEALNLFNKYFGAWEKSGKTEEIPPPGEKLKGGVSLIPKDVPQSVVVVGKFAPPAGSPDYYPFTVLDFIIGSGGFRSRIFQEIRTNQGLAYSSGSFYRAKNGYGIFGAYAMTKSSSTGKVLSFLNSIDSMVRTNPISQEELEWAKNSINNSFIFSFGSADQTARRQLMLEFEKLPADHLIKYPDNIKKVTLEDLGKALSRYIESTETVILVTGKEKDFDKPLSAFGSPERLKPDDD